VRHGVLCKSDETQFTPFIHALNFHLIDLPSLLFSSLSGLFPTLEQLQLLSVLLNLGVTAQTMHSFWADHSGNEWRAVEEDMSSHK
jgi:hypothetical protein